MMSFVRRMSSTEIRIFETYCSIDILCVSYGTALRWMFQDPIDDSHHRFRYWLGNTSTEFHYAIWRDSAIWVRHIVSITSEMSWWNQKYIMIVVFPCRLLFSFDRFIRACPPYTGPIPLLKHTHLAFLSYHGQSGSFLQTVAYGMRILLYPQQNKVVVFWGFF